MTTLHENALKLQELLSVPERWTTKEEARDSGGNEVYYYSTEAVCWCLLGGAAKVTNSKKEYGELTAQIRRCLLASSSAFIGQFNDSCNHVDIKSFLVDLVESTK